MKGKTEAVSPTFVYDSTKQSWKNYNGQLIYRNNIT
jgi:hypothetical protein